MSPKHLTSLDQAQQGLINYKGSICLKWKFGKLTVSLSQFAHLWAWSLKTLCPIPALPKTKAFRLFVAGRWWWPSEALPVEVGGLQPDQQVETIRTEIGDFVVFLVFLQNSRRRRRRCHRWCCCSRRCCCYRRRRCCCCHGSRCCRFCHCRRRTTFDVVSETSLTF